MTVKISKPALNLREELNKLDKPSGITGETLLRADTDAEARATLGIDNFEQVSVSTDGVISADGLTSSGRVGIGTSSPNHNLSVNSSSTGIISVGDFTGDNVKTYIEADQTNNVARLNSRNNHPLAFSVNNTERLRIDSSGNVGIGVTNVGAKLDVLVGGDERLLFTTLGSDPFIGAVSGANSSYKALQLNGSDLKLLTNGSEKARIDSSGNLLVGKTALGTTAGFEVRSAGNIVARRASGEVAIFDRKTNDGEIVRLAKDGTTVGSIASDSGSHLIIKGAGNNAALLFNHASSRIEPYSDSATDLGRTHAKFKDLYLSGGVYLGGTGAANKLDDYEEGTWTPALSFDVGGGSVAYTTQTGHYVKVGKTVSVTLLIEGISGVTSSDYYARLVLPFGTANTNQKIRTRVHNTGNTDFWATTAGGATPVMYASSSLNDWARGDDLNGQSISATFTYETA